MAMHLTQLNLWWTGDQLAVTATHGRGNDLSMDVANALIYLFKWRKFSESRWLILGTACSPLVVGFSVGLFALNSEIMAKGSSTYYLGGVEGLTPRLRKFCVVATLASRVCDSFIVGLFEDDRVARSVDSLGGRR